jgi:RNA polymerase sigma-70 factor, ECF subfamily
VGYPDGSIGNSLDVVVSTDSQRDEIADRSAAFERACHSEFRRVYGYIRYCVATADVADDLTAQTFADAARHLASYKPAKAPLEDWILSIARNLIRDHRRRERRWKWLPLDRIDGHAANGRLPDEQIIEDERNAALLTAISALSHREREVLGLKFAGGLANRAIAGVLGLTDNQVAVVVYRAIGRLRDRLAKERHHA